MTTGLDKAASAVDEVTPGWWDYRRYDTWRAVGDVTICPAGFGQ